MKTLLLAASLLLVGFNSRAQDAATALTQPAQPGTISALDVQNGFRAYILGTPIKDYPQLKRQSKDLYESPKESLLLSDVRLNKLVFGSYKGRLASITFGTTGGENIEKLVSFFITAYGPSTWQNSVMQRWTGAKATLYVTRVGAGDQEICIVMLKSNGLATEQQREERAAVK